MKKFIFIPVVSNMNLLEKAVHSVNPNIYDEYIIFNNSGGEIPESVYLGTPFATLIPDQPKSFTETQNFMREYAIKNNFDYYSFMHNDGEVHNDTDSKLVNFVENLNEDWGVVFTLYDVLCAFNTRAVEHIGEWGDEEWPTQKSGYYLDCDYYRRLSKSGYPQFTIPEHHITHTASNTIKNPEELKIWEDQRSAVVAHYIKKWGGVNGAEIYDHPFNDKDNR